MLRPSTIKRIAARVIRKEVGCTYARIDEVNFDYMFEYEDKGPTVYIKGQVGVENSVTTHTADFKISIAPRELHLFIIGFVIRGYVRGLNIAI